MLVITRKIGQAIRIGGDTVTLDETHKGRKAVVSCRGWQKAIGLQQCVPVGGAELWLLEAGKSSGKLGVKAPPEIKVVRL